MKFIILFALAAVAFAEPESDPYLLYNGGYAGYTGYNGYSGFGLARPYAGLGYSGYSSYPYVNRFGYNRFFKRDAEADSEADSEADPYLLYNGGYSGYSGYGLARPYGFGYNGYRSGFGYRSAYVSPYHSNFGYRTLFKRDAEAEPLWYNGFAGTPYTHNFGYAHAAAVHTPYVHHPYNFLGVKSYSNHALSPFGYAAKGQYAAVNAGAVHIAKREAEAEPLVYTNPLSLSTYAVGNAYTHGYAPRVYGGYSGYTGYTGYTGFSGYNRFPYGRFY